MNDKQKTRAAGDATERAMTETTAGSSSFSNQNNIISKGRNQGIIVSLLPQGEQNAISTRALMELAGYATARQLQKAIEAERAAGALILSASTGGYFRPQTGEAGRAEICRYEATLRRRAISTFRTLKTARRALKELSGQMTMEAGGDG